MPDLSMCQSNKCPSRSKCYRHEAKPDTYQAYAIFDEDLKDRLKCGYFIPLRRIDNLMSFKEAFEYPLFKFIVEEANLDTNAEETLKFLITKVGADIKPDFITGYVAALVDIERISLEEGMVIISMIIDYLNHLKSKSV